MPIIPPINAQEKTASLTIQGIGQIQVNVPNQLRFQCYEAQLINLANTLQARLANITHHGFKLDHANIITQLTNYFVNVLDEQIMLCMDKNIALYRKKNGIDLNLLDKNEAIQKFHHYLEECQASGTYAEYLHKQYPYLNQLFDRITTNFIDNTESMFTRLNNDFDILKKGFLKELDGTIQLHSIHPTGSDYHMQGNQVSILAFENAAGKSCRVVYKPTSVVADAMIAGDLEQLGQLDPRYANQKSMVDIFNLELKKNNQSLPTYLIVPREDARYDNKNIHRYYGYSQFLQHNPWHEIDFDQLLETEMRKFNPNSRKDDFVTISITNSIANLSVENIKKASLANQCDYITDDQKDIDRYSYECGLLISLMMATGLVDSHYGNLIIHKLHPYLLDMEACLTQCELNLQRMLCFDASGGSMSRNAVCMSCDIGKCLFDISGMHTINGNHVEKNLIFLKSDDILTACQPDYQIFLDGYKAGLNIIQNGGVSAWFNQEAVKSMPLRIIPFQTGHFTSEKNTLIKHEFNPIAFEAIRRGRYEEDKNEYKASVNHYASSPFSSAPLPYGCIYQSSRILDEYATMSIPFYYTFASDINLYDFNGHVIRIPNDYQVDPTLPDTFFSMSSLKFIEQRVNLMRQAENHTFLLQQVENYKEFLTTLSYDLYEISPFATINLKPQAEAELDTTHPSPTPQPSTKSCNIL